jgi:hypothetical protein
VGVSGTNFGKAAADYGKFRAGFPDSLFDRLKPFGVGMPGQHIVDLGTGVVALEAAAARHFDEELGRMLAAQFPPLLETPHRVFAALARHQGLH